MSDYSQQTQKSNPNPQGNSYQFVQQVAENISQTVSQIILGKRNEIRYIILGLLAKGHILIEDIPGVGKTMMAKALAKTIGASFNRIQFTSDMLPSDVTGVYIFNQKTREFDFLAGPIFAQIVLADEINRTTPKTQAALLEVMEERQITLDGKRHIMPEPFIILATQNPIEYEGTYPLPEAQLDRFMLRISLGYPTQNEEVTMLSSQQYQHPIQNIKPSVTVTDLLTAQQIVREIYVADDIKRYIVAIVNATREHPNVYLGSSPRGSIALMRTSQARAAMSGRDHVLPDDVKALAEATLAHRILLEPEARMRKVTAQVVLHSIMDTVAVPGAGMNAR